MTVEQFPNDAFIIFTFDAVDKGFFQLESIWDKRFPCDDEVAAKLLIRVGLKQRRQYGWGYTMCDWSAILEGLAHGAKVRWSRARLCCLPMT